MSCTDWLLPSQGATVRALVYELSLTGYLRRDFQAPAEIADVKTDLHITRHGTFTEIDARRAYEALSRVGISLQEAPVASPAAAVNGDCNANQYQERGGAGDGTFITPIGDVSTSVSMSPGGAGVKAAGALSQAEKDVFMRGFDEGMAAAYRSFNHTLDRLGAPAYSNPCGRARLLVRSLRAKA